jgi:dienelactone hydrolase
MRYRGYAELSSLPGELPRRDSAGRVAAESDFLRSYGAIDSVRARRELNTVVNAVRDAAHLKGSFPIIVYGPSLGAESFENNVLCEYLASNGYIVVASPSWGANGAMTTNMEGIDAQARDMEFLMAYARTLPYADAAHVAVMGYSWGGISNVLVAMRNSAATALVALDGSIAYWYHSTFKGGPGVSPDRLVIPTLFLKHQDIPLTPERRAQYGADTVFTFFDSLRYSDAYLVTLQTMRHQNFGALANKLQLSSSLTDGFIPDSAVTSVGYERVARFTLAFLNSYMKPARAIDALLTGPPEKNGIPNDEVTIVRRIALHPHRTVSDFVHTVGVDHLASAPEALARIRANDPTYVLPERDVNALAYRLFFSGHQTEAEGLCRLNVAMYPKSVAAYYSLAETYFLLNERARAIENFERVVALDPSNAGAVARLKQLRDH